MVKKASRRRWQFVRPVQGGLMEELLRAVEQLTAAMTEFEERLALVEEQLGTTAQDA